MESILIIDDDDAVRNLVRTILQREGYDCTEASGAKEARELLKNIKFDLIICDIKMPGESGIEFSRFSSTEYPDIAIILMTGFDSSQTAEQAMAIGIYGYLIKPFKRNQILVCVGNALRLIELEKKRNRSIDGLDALVAKRTKELQKRIKELEIARSELNKSEMEFRSIFENIHEAYYRIDLEGRLIMANPSGIRLMGYTSFDEIKNIKIKNFWIDQKKYKSFSDELRRMGRVSGYETSLRMKDGDLITVLIGSHLLFDADGALMATEGTLVDITERRALETQLSHARKLEAVGQLAAGIAHEINTPIQYVGDNSRFVQNSFRDLKKFLNKCQKLAKTLDEGMSVKDYLKKVQSAVEELDVDYFMEEIPHAIEQTLDGVERVSAIVRYLKEFAHPGIKEKTLMDINRSIENTVLVSQNEWKYVAEMETDLDSSLPLIPCLPGEINQVFLNIIINAAQAIRDNIHDYRDEKNTIRISTCKKGSNVEIRISDTGPGIPEEIQPMIFEPFFTTKDVGKGTGQGLAISRSVIEETHQGDLSFETEPGKGATFVIHLPIQ